MEVEPPAAAVEPPATAPAQAPAAAMEEATPPAPLASTDTTNSLVEMLITSALLLSDMVKRLTDAPNDVLTGRDTNHNATLAHWAALVGKLEVLELLHSRGAPIDEVVEASGMRPLHWACSKGQITTVRYLFTLGCSLEAPEARGQTPLMLSAQGEHCVLLQWLLQRGVDVTKIDRDGDTALHWAAYKGSLHSVCMLIEAGIKPTLADSYGSTPLHLAVGRNAMGPVMALLRHPEIAAMLEIKDNKGRTPLMVAEERGYTHLKEKLENPASIGNLERWLGDTSETLTSYAFGATSSLIEWSSESSEMVSRWFARQVGAEGSPAMERGMTPAPPPVSFNP